MGPSSFLTAAPTGALPAQAVPAQRPRAMASATDLRPSGGEPFRHAPVIPPRPFQARRAVALALGRRLSVGPRTATGAIRAGAAAAASWSAREQAAIPAAEPARPSPFQVPLPPGSAPG